MRVFSAILLIFISSAQSQEVAEEKPAATDPVDYLELQVGDDKILRNCRVTRKEADALIIAHSGGIARVSLFDVNPEIQKDYDFDPIAALDKYKKDQLVLSKMRKDRFLKAEKYKALEAAKADKERAYEAATKEWIPATGVVEKVNRKGVFVSAAKITFVPTKMKSTLGFTVDGPPKKVLKPLESGMVCLTGIEAKVGAHWRGYINPVCLQHVSFKPDEPLDISVHEAVTLKD